MPNKEMDIEFNNIGFDDLVTLPRNCSVEMSAVIANDTYEGKTC